MGAMRLYWKAKWRLEWWLPYFWQQNLKDLLWNMWKSWIKSWSCHKYRGPEINIFLELDLKKKEKNLTVRTTIIFFPPNSREIAKVSNLSYFVVYQLKKKMFCTEKFWFKNCGFFNQSFLSLVTNTSTKQGFSSEYKITRYRAKYYLAIQNKLIYTVFIIWTHLGKNVLSNSSSKSLVIILL